MDLMSLTAVELGEKIKNKEVTVKEAVEESLRRIEALEKDVNSFVTVDREGALKQAEEIQKKIDLGELSGPLAGVPVAIKDNMCTEGLLTTCSSKILSNFVPTYTATAVEKLKEAGAVIIGKTNMDVHPRPRIMVLLRTPGIWTEFREARQVVLRQQFPLRRYRMHLVQIQAVQSDSLQHSVV